MRKAALLVILAAVCVGCGKPSPPKIVEVNGIIRMDGRPLKGVEVRFIPKSDDFGPEYTAAGVTDEAGRFQLHCKDQPGALACANQVLLLEAPLPGNLRGQNSQPDRARYYRSLGGRPIP